MPKNKKGGKKAKRGKNVPTEERQLLLREEEQEYARVIKRLGGAPARIEARILGRDGEADRTMICVIRGKMRKKVWLNQDDLILVALRDFQDDRADVIHKYKEHEKWKLIRMGEVEAGEDEVPPEEPEPQLTKKKKNRPNGENWLDNDMLPPSDSEEESEGTLPESQRFTKEDQQKKAIDDILNGNNLDDDVEINLEDL